MNPNEINCKITCKDGCVLGDECPNLEYKSQASEFIETTSLDDMLAIAEAAIRRKATAAPKWVFPEGGVSSSDSQLSN